MGAVVFDFLSCADATEPSDPVLDVRMIGSFVNDLRTVSALAVRLSVVFSLAPRGRGEASALRPNERDLPIRLDEEFAEFERVIRPVGSESSCYVHVSTLFFSIMVFRGL